MRFFILLAISNGFFFNLFANQYFKERPYFSQNLKREYIGHINFRRNSHHLSNRELSRLSMIAERIFDRINYSNPFEFDFRIRLVGFTDKRGQSQYNFDLGMRRAQTVARSLEHFGVPMDQATVVSYGESLSFSENRGQRKVEIWISRQTNWLKSKNFPWILAGVLSTILVFIFIQSLFNRRR